jgi:hypothetical protein
MKTITQNLIAPCGMNCGICRAFLREKNSCHGCINLGDDRARAHCRLRVCTKRTGTFCCRCPEFPCERLWRLDKRYRTKYGMSEIENLEFIREYGIRKFVASERKRWISKKGILCVHDRKYYK